MAYSQKGNPMSNKIKNMLSQESLSQLIKFQTYDEYLDHSLDDKVEYILSITTNFIESTKKELTGYFTSKEAHYLTSCFWGGVFDFSTDSPKFLLRTRDFHDPEFGNISDSSNEEIEILIDKISNLTEYQAFVVLQMFYEYVQAVAISENSFDIWPQYPE
jgi:hypothetical protein